MPTQQARNHWDHSGHTTPSVAKSNPSGLFAQEGWQKAPHPPARRKLLAALGFLGLATLAAFSTYHLLRVLHNRRQEAAIAPRAPLHSDPRHIAPTLTRASMTIAPVLGSLLPGAPAEAMEAPHIEAAAVLPASVNLVHEISSDKTIIGPPRPASTKRAGAAKLNRPAAQSIAELPASKELPTHPEVRIENSLSTSMTPIIFSPPRDPNETELRLLREHNLKKN